MFRDVERRWDRKHAGRRHPSYLTASVLGTRLFPIVALFSEAGRTGVIVYDAGPGVAPDSYLAAEQGPAVKTVMLLSASLAT